VLIASLILVVVAGALAAPVIVLLFEILAALLLPQRPESFFFKDSQRQSIAVIVPAHNEGSGILSTLADIKAQLISGDRLLVVADNCNDDTAIVATEAGAEVVERNEPHQAGKGYALDFGYKHLSRDPRAIVICIDADCRVKRGTIERLAVACQTTQRPIQALDLMIAPDGSPISYRVAEFAWRVKNWLRPLGLSALGLPCHLMGTGMAFPWKLLRSATLANASVVEDVNLGFDLAKAGAPALFCPFAEVTSLFPWSIEGAKQQRKRWEEGSVRLIATTVPRHIGEGLWTKNFGLIALALDSIVPPLSLLVMLVAGTFVVIASAALLGFSSTAFYISAACVIGLLLAVFLAWLKHGRDLLPLKSIPSVVPYVLAKLPLYRQIFSSRAAPSWVRADRPGISTRNSVTSAAVPSDAGSNDPRAANGTSSGADSTAVSTSTRSSE